MNKKIVGFFSLLLTGLTFGSFGIWIRILSNSLSIYQQIVLRSLFAAIFAFAIIVFGKRFVHGLRNVNKPKIILYALIVPVYIIFFNVAVLKISIGVTVFTFYIGSIIFSWILGSLIFKEKTTPMKSLSLLLVLIGLFCFMYPLSRDSVNIGLVSALVSGVMDGVANWLRKDLGGKLDKFVLVFITTVGGVAVSGLLMLFARQNMFFLNQLTLQTWVLGAGFGFMLVAANYLMLIGFQNFDLGLGVIILSSELVFALLFGLFVFKEVPLTKELIGGLFVLLAIIL